MRIKNLLLLWILTACLLSGCGGRADAPDMPSAGEPAQTGSTYRVDTLKLAGGTDWGTPSPFLHVSRGPGQSKMRLVFASLLEKDESGDVPWLAESWSMDAVSYTHLRAHET